MVAVRQAYEVPEEPADVAVSRAEVERLQAGLRRPLLATPPDVLRAIAWRAVRARGAAERWERRVGERPQLDPEADAAAVAAKAAYDEHRLRREQTVDRAVRVLARGNAGGLLAFAVAGGLVLAGSSPVDLPVAVAIAVAPVAPLTGSWIGARAGRSATRAQRAAHARWCDALEATGLPTMGALAARRVTVSAWERRREEAAAAWENARPHLRAWQLLAGPGIPPDDVEDVLLRVEALRQAQLRLLGMLIGARVEGSAMAVLAPVEEVAAPEDAPRWLTDALHRFRGGRLRLFGT